MMDRPYKMMAAAALCAGSVFGACCAAEIAAPVAITDPMQKARDAAEVAGYSLPLREALIQVASQPENRDRLRAITALGDGRIGDAAAVKALTGVLKAEDVALRASAVWALGQGGGKDAVAPVKGAFADPAAEVRAAACEALIHLSASDFAYPLTDPERSVRLAAANAIRWYLMQPSQALSPEYTPLEQARIFRAINNGENPSVKWVKVDDSAIRQKLCGQLAEAFAKETEDLVKVPILEGLQGMAEENFAKIQPLVKSALLSGTPSLQVAGLQVLRAAAKKDGAAAGVFAGNAKNFAADDKPWQLRVAAAQTLAVLDPAWANKTLPAWCAEDNPYIRRAAARALALSGDGGAVAVLEKLLSDREYSVRRTASISLLALADRKVLAEDALLKLAAEAANGDEPLRAGCGLWLLAERRSAAGFPGILKYSTVDIATDSDRVPLAALLMHVIAQTAYKDGAEAAVKFFSQDKGDEKVRLQALAAIRVLRPASCVEPLCKKLAAFKTVESVSVWTLTGQLRRQTILTLLTIGGPAVVDGMLDDVLSPKPVEDDELVALICQWLADSRAVDAAPVISRAKGGKAFSDYVKSVLAWTEGRLTGKEAASDVPPPAVALPLPPFLSGAKQ